VPKRSSRAVAKKNDLSLTPPEEIRAQRTRRFILIGAAMACAAGVVIYFAAPPIGGAIKAWQSRRLARESFALIEQGKWNEANAKVRNALLLRWNETEAWRAAGKLTSRTSQWAAALDWWKKTDGTGRLTIEDRRDYIAGGTGTGGRRSDVGGSSRLASERPSSGTRLRRTRARERARKTVRNCLRCNTRSFLNEPLFEALRGCVEKN
jgi:hypothetical protein